LNLVVQVVLSYCIEFIVLPQMITAHAMPMKKK